MKSDKLYRRSRTMLCRVSSQKKRRLARRVNSHRIKPVGSVARDKVSDLAATEKETEYVIGAGNISSSVASAYRARATDDERPNAKKARIYNRRCRLK